LDLPVRVGFSRLRGTRDRMEAKARAFHERVRRGYLALARQEPWRIVVVEATRPSNIAAKEILGIVLSRLSIAKFQTPNFKHQTSAKFQ
jgi:dTMP kinase